MQNNVCISTKESDLKIEYGLFNLRSERELARASVKYILTDMNDIRRSYIRLGFHLWEFDRLKYYQDFGYLTLAEFCDANLGMDKTAVSRCLNVFLEFGLKDERGIYKMQLDERYQGYSYSQLCEMSSMSAGDRKYVKPDMTIKEIREVKKELRAPASVATSQQPIYDFFDLCECVVKYLQQFTRFYNIHWSSDFMEWLDGLSFKRYRLIVYEFDDESEENL